MHFLLVSSNETMDATHLTIFVIFLSSLWMHFDTPPSYNLVSPSSSSIDECLKAGMVCNSWTVAACMSKLTFKQLILSASCVYLDV